MNLYAGNLNFNLSEDELRQIFEEYGEVVSVNIITDKYSGRSKGFGFVEMANQEDGERVCEELDGTEVGGRNIKVNQATDKPKNFKRDNNRRDDNRY